MVDGTPKERVPIETIALWIALLTVAMLFFFFAVNVYVALARTDSPYFQNVMKGHLSSFLMLPQVASLSFAVVMLLRQTEGPFEFKFLGVEAKGASGQVVMWVFTFLALTLALHLVW